jgi:hypothetical protein
VPTLAFLLTNERGEDAFSMSGSLSHMGKKTDHRPHSQSTLDFFLCSPTCRYPQLSPRISEQIGQRLSKSDDPARHWPAHCKGLTDLHSPLCSVTPSLWMFLHCQ